MKLIVGLGNPGEKYASNRHNIGFMAVDEIARGYGFGPWKKRFQGLAAEGQIGLEKCLLLKPSTYMNESGRSVGEAMRFYKLALGDVIVIHDEIDLDPGKIRVKTGGGNAGHNGLKSISAHIGNEYKRVRLGIGHPGEKALVANYVLQDFAKADKTWLTPLLEGVARGMARLVEGSDAGFLSEAARGRVRLAVKTDGAAVSKPAPAMVVHPFPVASREGGVAAISKTVVVPLPSVDALEGDVAVLEKEPDAPQIKHAPPQASREEAKIFAAAEPKIVLRPVKKSLRERLARWFHTRVRGGD
jgi:PTH1 family peptidyl-tRNA hydrolase